jgi:hypothetical protein
MATTPSGHKTRLISARAAAGCRQKIDAVNGERGVERIICVGQFLDVSPGEVHQAARDSGPIALPGHLQHRI